MPRLTLEASVQSCPLIRPFAISTGVRTHQDVLTVTLSDGEFIGRGQATGLKYLGQSPQGLHEQIEAFRAEIERGLSRHDLMSLMAPNGARSALDAALWELDAARSGQTVSELMGISPKPLASAFTISLDDPDLMASQTRKEAHRPLLKVKLGAPDGRDGERMIAVAKAAPGVRKVIDANAGWAPQTLKELAPLVADLDYELVEQPLAMGLDDDPTLRDAARRIPLCADESAQTIDDLDRVAGVYQVVNIKLDKCGGLTAAMDLKAAARERGLKVFVGCMLAPTLAIAPAFLLAQDADYADLDGPFWFRNEPARLNSNGFFEPIDPSIWGDGQRA